ncbi:hypothetical protein ACFLSJ_00695 [Verrucomicrobiota bacterium]
MRKVFACALIVLLLGGSTLAWVPSEWVWFTWPFAYSFNEGGWYYMNQGDRMWCLRFDTGQWYVLGQAECGLSDGWSFYYWPFAYSWDHGAWYYLNETDEQWCVHLATGAWGLLGQGAATTTTTVAATTTTVATTTTATITTAASSTTATTTTAATATTSSGTTATSSTSTAGTTTTTSATTTTTTSPMGLLVEISPAGGPGGDGSTIPFEDAFEDYAAGSAFIGVNGWEASPWPPGVGVVSNWSYPYAGTYPLSATTHVQVASISGPVTNMFKTDLYSYDPDYDDPGNLLTNVCVEMMLHSSYLSTDPRVGDQQVACYVRTTGHLVVRHAYYIDHFQDERIVWSELEHPAVDSNEWMRLTLDLWYVADEPYFEGEHWFQIAVNGNVQSHALAYSWPPGITFDEHPDGGTWFLCADSGYANPGHGENAPYFTGIRFRGIGCADDLVVREGQAIRPPTTTTGLIGSRSLDSRD